MSDGISHEDLVQGLSTSLKKLVESKGGKLMVGADAAKAAEMLLMSPGSWRAVVFWGGDTQLGDNDQSPLVTCNLNIYVGYAPGLPNASDKAMLRASGNRPSLLSLTNTVRKRVLALLFPEDTTSVNLRYAGANQLVTVDGAPLSAFQMNFQLDYAPEVDEPEQVEISSQ